MNFDDPNFLQNLRDALRNVQEFGYRQQPRRGELRQVDEFKVNELPEFIGGTDPETYLEWERKIDRMFEFKDLEDEKRCKYAILKLSRGASLWFEGMKAQRARAGKTKITSWDTLKRKLRKRYVPATHKLAIYRRIAELTQGKLSVSDYIDEFGNLALMGEIEENEELKMSRFLRGLNRNIANSVELYPYADFDTLCGLCLKIETQGKLKYASTCGEGSRAGVWKNDGGSKVSSTSNNSVLTPKTVAAPITNPSNKATNTKETSLSKVRCFKCQGFGHYQNACPNKRVITLREAIDVREELLAEEERLGEIFNLNEDEDKGSDGDVETYDAPNYDVALVLRTLQIQSAPIESE